MTRSQRRKVAIFMGTRPEAIKLAPVIRQLEGHPALEPLVISTGQHRELLDQVVDLFQIPLHHRLEVMRPNQSLAELTARLLAACDPILHEEKPALVLVQGDTATALSAALCAFYRQIPIGHVEAGLRTGNYQAPFPEEANRVLTARLASLHFAPTRVSKQNLLDEGVDPRAVHVTGNTVIDALKLELARQAVPEHSAAVRDALAKEGLALAPLDSRPMVLITGHRRENFGSGLEALCGAIVQLAHRFSEYRFVYLVHPNPNVKGPVEELLQDVKNVQVISPRPYSQFVALLRHCKLILTDSGGVQEEAPSFGKPVLVVREVTERPEGVEAGTVRVVGADRDRIVQGVTELLTSRTAYDKMANVVNPYGDGRASERIVETVASYLMPQCHGAAWDSHLLD